jgi:hypothetical protein
MSAQTQNLDLLQTQYDEISKQLKEAKKARDNRQRLVGKAILDMIEEQSDTGSAKMLVDLLHRRILNVEDRKIISLDDLVQKTDDLMKKAKTAPLSSLASASGA